LFRFSVRPLVVTTVVMALALSAATVTAPAAGADSLGDKQAQAEQISSKLAALDTQMEVLGEQYNQARVKLDQVQTDIDRATRQVEVTNAALVLRRDELAAYAVEAYVKGGQSDLPGILLKGSGPEVSHRIEYLSAISGNRRQLIDDMRAAQGTADVELTSLEDARARAQSLRGDLQQKQHDTEKASSQQQALLNSVTGELVDLVAQAQARQAQADEQAIMARLASTPRPGPGSAAGPTIAPDPTGNPSPDLTPPAIPPPIPPAIPPPSTRPGAPPTTAPPVTSPPVLPPPPSNPPPPVLSAAARAVALAKTQLGVPYLWAGDDPSTGFDCSGLLEWAWRGVGKVLPHSAELMYQVTRRMAVADLQPGDFIFYGSPIHHVSMYVGGGQMIEAPHTGAFVRIASIYRSDLVGAGRVV
jgi:cell wall-associated NlpC family hydrolase